MRYFGCALTDVGIKKQTNQDSLCLKIAKTSDNQQAVLAVVCDGMGGLEKGELASATVIRTLSNWFENDFEKCIPSFEHDSLVSEWENMLYSLNQKILSYGKKTGVNLGTTLTALLIFEKKYMTIHVGDSRIYEITDIMNQITEDQTFIAREIQLGHMTIEEAKNDSRKNMLLQCVGASRIVTPDISFGYVKPNATYMLCSDGFRHVISDEEMYDAFNPAILNNTSIMKKNANNLIEIIKSRNEKDNISVILLKTEE